MFSFRRPPLFHMDPSTQWSLQNGPSQSMIALTLLLVLLSAWFTGIIGVHPIFGGEEESDRFC